MYWLLAPAAPTVSISLAMCVYLLIVLLYDSSSIWIVVTSLTALFLLVLFEIGCDDDLIGRGMKVEGRQRIVERT